MTVSRNKMKERERQRERMYVLEVMVLWVVSESFWSGKGSNDADAMN